MTGLFRKMGNHPTYTRFYFWGKLIAVTGGFQALIQVTGLVCGVLIIRFLPTKEYAYYTLANATLGTMTVLSDGGISVGVMSQGGKIWQNKQKLGAVLITGLALRRQFALISLLVASPILMFLLVHHGASVETSILITLSLIPAFYAALSDSLLELVPKLHQKVYPLQLNQISVGISRLLVTTIALFLFPFTYIAILANGIPRIFGNIRLRKISNAFIDKYEKPDIQVRKSILKIVKRVLPGSLYYCLSGQLTIWLISVFGNTNAIAQLGALGRLSMILNVLSTIVSILIIPRFARLSDNKKVLLNRFLLIIVCVSVLSLIIIGLAWLFPQEILIILGRQYMGLHKELLLNILGSCIALVWGTAFSLYTSRGWIINPFFAILLSIAAIIVGVNIFDISTIIGVLYLNIFIACIEFIYHVTFGLYKILNS